MSNYPSWPYVSDPSHLANETPPWDLSSRLLSSVQFSSLEFDLKSLPDLKRNADLDGEELLLERKKVYIYFAPCICQIWTAFRICNGARSFAKTLLQFCVRVDNRLTATCYPAPSSAAGIAAIAEQIRSMEMDEECHLKWSDIQYIDRDWIDQRVYIEEDEMFQTSAVDEARSLSFIFNPLSVKDKLAAVIILGERDHLVPMLQYSPFRRLERPPRENQFFKVQKRYDSSGT